jgi:type IV secretory pathway VirB3-like protein
MQAFERGREPLYISATRPHLILGLDPRGFWVAVALFSVSILARDMRINIAGGSLALLIALVAHALGTRAPYALDEIQRFLLLPGVGTASASRYAPYRFSPYRRRKNR